MDSHDDLRRVADRLRAARPEATALELDAVWQRVRGARSRTKRTPGFMRTRAAILTTLALGFLLSTTGAGLAVSGFADNDQAAVAQYPEPAPTSTPSGGVQGEAVTRPAPGADEQQVIVEDDKISGGGAPGSVQTTRQVEAGAQGGGSQLPFTGFAAIPVLLLGLGLLAGGMALRRGTRQS